MLVKGSLWWSKSSCVEEGGYFMGHETSNELDTISNWIAPGLYVSYMYIEFKAAHSVQWVSMFAKFTDTVIILRWPRIYIYGGAIICHQARWLRWGHPSLFHIAMSLLIWYEMFCVRDISCRLIWMEFINIFSVYAQSGAHSRFNC